MKRISIVERETKFVCWQKLKQVRKKLKSYIVKNAYKRLYYSSIYSFFCIKPDLKDGCFWKLIEDISLATLKVYIKSINALKIAEIALVFLHLIYVHLNFLLFVNVFYND